MTSLGLRRISDKRAAELRESRAVKAAVLERDGGCVGAELVPYLRCWGRLDPHHVLRRSRGGKDTEENMVTLCRAHHGYAHEHPLEAKQLGLLR
jgi:hypothetical protein